MQSLIRTRLCTTIFGALQLAVSDWHEYLRGGRVADPILYRLVHNSHRLALKCGSRRKHKREIVSAS